ncbi:hypothetical protein [Streptomyces mirabilis]|uniref:hypothetical protein n=1 Tax=Streptomyces mirabilis TaxID=68239 RepID=UPI00365CC5E7
MHEIPEGRRTPMDAVQRTVTSAGARPAAAENKACSPLRTSPRDNQVSASPSSARGDGQAVQQMLPAGPPGRSTDGGHRVHPRSAPCASSSADGSMAS